MGKFIDLTGKIFGRLTVIKRAENRDNHPAWTCVCTCGKETTVVGNSLRGNKTKSCGCLSVELSSERNKDTRDKSCDACGVNVGRIRDSAKFNMMLCDKHYAQMDTCGRILIRSHREPNEIIIRDDYAEIVLQNRKYDIVGFAKVDINDIPKIEHLRWNLGARGYVTSGSGKNKVILLHRLIMDCPEDMVVDHINHDRQDNRRSELRICSHKENSRNSHKRLGSLSSIYKGVYFRRTRNSKPWHSRIHVDGKEHHIGYYTNEVEAAVNYDIKAKEYFKEFAKLNFPDEVSA